MKPLDLKIGIVGMGAIGSNFAALFTGNGYKTTVIGRKPQSVFMSIYDGLYDTLEARKLITKAQRELCRNLVSYTTDYSGLADADIVIESVPEDIAEKYKVYEKIEAACEKIQVLASATSALSPDDLKKGVKKWPEKVLVAHPFNPPHIVPFLEIVRSSETEQKAVDLTYAFFESCGRKVCIMKKSAPGFIANRLQHALLREAMYMVDNGMADPQDIDKALMNSFMPRYTSIGIFEHHDAYGMDMLEKLQNYLYPHLAAGTCSPDMVVNKVKAGTLGMKTGKGIYEWNEASIADFKKRAAEPYWQFFNWNLPS
ncbi:MAG: 3-hydroxyacyl-CoA dehydrogenase family protein [Spirochaetales bacterium]|jgi:3-hydroxybutyryl-CoA dehydrogenase|nr:3-hydroxyacyl-CoA dehydrogenase family protein [Spirochaetales bacterium]